MVFLKQISVLMFISNLYERLTLLDTTVITFESYAQIQSTLIRNLNEATVKVNSTKPKPR